MAVGARHYGEILRAVPPTGWRGSKSMPTGSTTGRPPSPAACASACRSPATWSSDPRLVFMDEPTGGLDVSVQARILDLLRGLVERLHLPAVLVTHDLGVARLLTHRHDGHAGRRASVEQA